MVSNNAKAIIVVACIAIVIGVAVPVAMSNNSGGDVGILLALSMLTYDDPLSESIHIENADYPTYSDYVRVISIPFDLPVGADFAISFSMKGKYDSVGGDQGRTAVDVKLDGTHLYFADIVETYTNRYVYYEYDGAAFGFGPHRANIYLKVIDSGTVVDLDISVQVIII